MSIQIHAESASTTFPPSRWLVLLTILGLLALTATSAGAQEGLDFRIPDPDALEKSAASDPEGPGREKLSFESRTDYRVELVLEHAASRELAAELGVPEPILGAREYLLGQAAWERVRESGLAARLVAGQTQFWFLSGDESSDSRFTIDKRSLDKATGTVGGGTQAINVPIPDNQGAQTTGAFISFDVFLDLPSVPAGATVTNLRYSTRLHNDNDPNNFFAGDYNIYLTNDSCASGNYDFDCVEVWNGGALAAGPTDGGHDDDPENDADIELSLRQTSAFNGNPLAQVWAVNANDHAPADVGFIEFITLSIDWQTQGGGGCVSNSDCAATEYCHKDTGANGAACGFVSGACMNRPAVCTSLPGDVCGCDGQTYINEECAHNSGVNVAHAGGGCSAGQTCTSSSQCPRSSEDWCEKPQGMCGGTGTCTDRPWSFTCDFIDPVCGCDGQTYNSECHAHLNFVNVAHSGACSGGGGGNQVDLEAIGINFRDGINGNVVANPTTNSLVFAHFTYRIHNQSVSGRPWEIFLDGQLLCRASNNVRTPGTYNAICAQGVTLQPGAHVLAGELDRNSALSETNEGNNTAQMSYNVGGNTECFSNSDCGSSEFCDKDSCQFVVPGICTPEPSACPQNFDPVCGCNGVTFFNECFANDAGQNVSHVGECATGNACTSDSQCNESTEDWCQRPQGSCGASGTCTDRPPDFACDTVAPVCGCDGVTYNSECHAHRAFTSVAHTGACTGGGNQCSSNSDCGQAQYCHKDTGGNGAACGFGQGECRDRPVCTSAPGDVCGCDGQTYLNEECAHTAGVNVAHAGGGCAFGQTCTSDSDCPRSPEDWCEKPEGMCGGTGMCRDRPWSFTCDFSAPVCGCDGNTYDSECRAHLAFTNVAHTGACTGGGGGQCPSGGPCLSNADCGPDDFCEKPEVLCGNVGTCTARPAACNQNFDPVCGCDGTTYNNECFAQMSGQSVGNPGPCTTCVDDVDNGVVCLADNRFEFTMTWTDRFGVTRPVFFDKYTSRSALVFFFAGRRDIVLTVKAIPACTSTGHFIIWQGGASGGGAGWNLTVRDTLTGQTQPYSKPLGTFENALKDDSTFPCP